MYLSLPVIKQISNFIIIYLNMFKNDKQVKNVYFGSNLVSRSNF